MLRWSDDVRSGLRHIAQLLSQAQQAQLVFDDGLIYNIHAGLLGLFDWSHDHQTQQPRLFQAGCQI